MDGTAGLVKRISLGMRVYADAAKEEEEEEWQESYHAANFVCKSASHLEQKRYIKVKDIELLWVWVGLVKHCVFSCHAARRRRRRGGGGGELFLSKSASTSSRSPPAGLPSSHAPPPRRRWRSLVQVRPRLERSLPPAHTWAPPKFQQGGQKNSFREGDYKKRPREGKK